MPDTDTTSGAAGQAVQFGSDVLSELESAVKQAEVPPPAAAEFDASHPELGTPGAPEPVPIPVNEPTAEPPRVTKEQAQRIQDIVERAKTEIATIVQETRTGHAALLAQQQEQDEQERQRKAQELIAKFQGTPTP